MKRCVIIGGAPIRNYQAIRNYLSEDDYTIFCDCGLQHRAGLGIEPDLIVGDFDSWEEDQDSPALESERDPGKSLHFMESDAATKENARRLKETSGITLEHSEVTSESEAQRRFPNELAETLVLPPEKYDTDTMFAVREGIRRGYTQFLFLGVIGRRLDHTLGNLYILNYLYDQRMHGVMVDDYSDIELVGSEGGNVSDRYAYFSLLNITGTAKEIQITNAKYCYLPDREITNTWQYGISNEVLPGRTARITVKEGKLLLIRVR